MSIWIVDLMPVKWTFTAEPPPAPKPKPFYTREPGEIFDHLENGDAAYMWDSYNELQQKHRKFYRRLMIAIEKDQIARAAYSARHLFRIARAMERKGRQWK